MTTFTKTILFTDVDGRARFREETIPLDQGSPQSMLSSLMASKCSMKPSIACSM